MLKEIGGTILSMYVRMYIFDAHISNSQLTIFTTLLLACFCFCDAYHLFVIHTVYVVYLVVILIWRFGNFLLACQI